MVFSAQMRETIAVMRVSNSADGCTPNRGGGICSHHQSVLYCIVLSCLVLCYTGGCGHRTDSHAGAGTFIIRSYLWSRAHKCPVSSTRIAGEKHFENSVRWVLILISEMTLAVLWISLSFEFAGTLLPL